MKYDRCNIPYADFPGESEQQVQQTLYTRMSNALKATGRPIVFSMCNPDPGDAPWEYGASIANMWRTATDIQDNFGSMLANFEANVGHFADAGPGAWNDPDLLQIGNGGSSLSDYTTEFSLWAEMAAPLIASTNLATLTHAELAIYENANVIAVDQDPLGRPGVPISSANGLWVLSKELSDGGRAVLLFNATNTAATISTTAKAAGLPKGQIYQMDNLWTNAVTQTGGAISAFVPGHGVAMFTVTAVGSGDRTRCRHTPCCRSRPLAAGRRRRLDHRVRVVHERRRVRRQEAPPDPVGLARLAGQAARPRRRPAAQARARVHGRLSRDRAASGPPLAFSIFTGGASYDPLDGRSTSLARLGELVASPVHAPLSSADVTTHPAAFGASGGRSRSARGGWGCSTRRSARCRPTPTPRSTNARVAGGRAPRRSPSPRTPPAEPRAAPG